MKERPNILTTLKFNSLINIIINSLINLTMKHCPKISPSIRNVKTLQTSTETISSCYKLIGQCHMMLNFLHPQLLLRQFFNPTILCPTENTLVRWIHRIHRTIWLCHNHQASRLHTSPIELNPACHDVIFSPSDNSLFYDKHPLSDGSIGSIGQSDFNEVATITRQAACTHP